MPYADDDLRAKADQVTDALLDLAVRMDPGWAGGPDGVRAFVRDQATHCMTLDTTAIISELDRVREIVKKVDPDRGMAFGDAMDEAHGVLHQWEGSAAEAFRARLRDIRAFGKVQYDRSLAYAKALATLAALGDQARADYFTVADETITAAGRTLDDAKEAGRAFAIKVGAAFAKAVFSGFKLEDVAGAAVDVSAEGVTTHINSGAFDEVMRNHQAAVGAVASGLAEGFGQVKLDLRTCVAGTDDTRAELASPLPSSTRISSPDFSYEGFAIDSRPVDEFGSSVTEVLERMKFDPEPVLRPSPVSLRLDGDH